LSSGALPDFRSSDFLRGHVRRTMAFYDNAPALDPRGGFFHYFRDDGQVYDRTTRHLVSSTRFVFTQAMAYRHFGERRWAESARHAWRFLQDVHRNPSTGAYAWLLRWDGDRAEVLDPTNHCYGLAFVLLAHAHALMAGIDEARGPLDDTFELLERRFWESEHGLYADEAGADWTLAPYRGQNANMHACEAMLAAWEATHDERFLDRAQTLAVSVTERLAAPCDGLIWEHYRSDWSIDPDYNRHDRSNIFRPWGYQPGHLVEWAKLLLILDRHRPSPRWLPRATELFNAAVSRAWDADHGGLVYGFGPDGRWCDDDKYFWVQAEALAAAALLALRVGPSLAAGYWRWYDELWAYSWKHLVDHRHGAWYRIVSRENRPLSDEKSPAGKVDYHTMGACYEVLGALRGTADTVR
jgi:mannose/cellobiose epimerase-like protein (N-acyl-D-glucosamine 2-epimerase family)